MRWGVSTSRYPLSLKNCLVFRMILALCSRAVFRLANGQFFVTDLFLDPGRIFAGSGVNGDQLPILDEGRNTQFISCLNGGGFVIGL